MQETLKKICDHLGIGRTLLAYETDMISVDEGNAFLTCEARMNAEGSTLDAEVQVSYDPPQDDKPPFEQFMHIHASGQNIESWTLRSLKIRNKDRSNEFGGWESKAMALFKAIYLDVKAGKMPDLDKLLDEIYKEDKGWGGRKGGGSSKAPKIKPAALLDMKRGGSF